MDTQVVMVTGAAGHLGRAVAAAFAARGASLVLLAREADQLVKAYGGDDARRLLLAADLADAQAVASTVAGAMARFGRIDALCNVAGAFRMGEMVHADSDKDWDAMFDANVRSLRHMARAVVPHMLAAGRGAIVNVGSAAAAHGQARMAAYGASKEVVLRLTEAMSAELRGKGIRVNCVLPGTIDTPDNRRAMPDADTSRWVAPEALADVIVFLASDAARAVHGAGIPVTG